MFFEGIKGRDLLPTLAKHYDKDAADSLTPKEQKAKIEKLQKHKEIKKTVRKVTAVSTTMTVENRVKNIENQVFLYEFYYTGLTHLSA